MAKPIQISIDAASPTRLGKFWCQVLGYVEQPPPPGFETWDGALGAFGIDRSDPDRAYSIVDPDGVGPRLFLQKVPEGKTSKNRFHLDVHVGAEELESTAQLLVEMGAEVVQSFDEPEGRWISMKDPEGNEFCLEG